MGVAFLILFSVWFAPPEAAWGEALPIGSSLIQDRGFESGFVFWNQNWSDISILNTTTPLFGATSLRLGAAPGGRAQKITAGIEEGAKYRVSGHASVFGPTDVATIGIEFKNAAGINILDQWIQVTGSSPRLYTFEVRIPYGTNYMYLYAFKNNGTQPVDFDELDLVKIAEP